jgi:UDP-N-acetyl-D-glucosamine dehydrogenase
MGNNLAVIGLGYVGLPLALKASRSGFNVFGIDIDLDKVSLINQGLSTISDVNKEEIQLSIESGMFRASSNFQNVELADVVVICVPTPLDMDRNPDLTILEAAIKSVAQNVKEGTLVILESTVSPGTTREILIPKFYSYSETRARTLKFAFSPERIDPANKLWNVTNTPKVVSGIDKQSTQAAVEFYSKLVNKIHICSSPEIAELSKLLENSFRYINISFINEFRELCNKLGVEVNEVIEASATKPYGFMPFYPSTGVGGHCIPVDPLYLSDKARKVGATAKFIDLADSVNISQPEFFVKWADKKINGLSHKRVIVIGVSYKPNVTDVRETPVKALILALRQNGAQVFWHDDLVKEWNGEKSSNLDGEYDLAILATRHDYLDMKVLGNTPLISTGSSI